VVLPGSDHGPIEVGSHVVISKGCAKASRVVNAKGETTNTNGEKMDLFIMA